MWHVSLLGFSKQLKKSDFCICRETKFTTDIIQWKSLLAGTGHVGFEQNYFTFLSGKICN
jgi:hypothetical protein